MIQGELVFWGICLSVLMLCAGYLKDVYSMFV